MHPEKEHSLYVRSHLLPEVVRSSLGLLYAEGILSVFVKGLLWDRERSLERLNDLIQKLEKQAQNTQRSTRLLSAQVNETKNWVEQELDHRKRSRSSHLN